MNKNEYIKGFKDGIPIALGYISVSFTFGMMATEKLVPIIATILISMTNLTSAGQFAGLDLIVTGGAFIEMALTQLVINLRYALMSISLSQKFNADVSIIHRIFIAFGVTDEIFAVAMGQKNDVGKNYMYGLITAPYFGWTIGTIIGAVASSLLPVSIRMALGIAIYGMFIAIFIPVAKKSKAVLTVISVSVALSCCFNYIPVLKSVSSGFVIIICAVISAVVGAIIKPVDDSQEVLE